MQHVEGLKDLSKSTRYGFTYVLTARARGKKGSDAEL